MEGVAHHAVSLLFSTLRPTMSASQRPTFQLVRELASGACASVYVATDLSTQFVPCRTFHGIQTDVHVQKRHCREDCEPTALAPGCNIRTPHQQRSFPSKHYWVLEMVSVLFFILVFDLIVLSVFGAKTRKLFSYKSWLLAATCSRRLMRMTSMKSRLACGCPTLFAFHDAVVFIFTFFF